MSQIVLTADSLGSTTAGAFEYDGRVVYVTPQGTQRGIIPGAQFYRLNADYTPATTSTSAQGIFGVGAGSGLGVTLSSNTVYAFESVYVLAKTASATSHNISIGFGGTASVNNILYVNYNGGVNQAALPVLVDTVAYSTVSTATAQNLSGTISSANRIQTMRMTGTVSIGTGGTLIPQYTTSAAVGPYSTVAGSYFLIYPLSISGSNTSVGAWA
jgi:hypothetical protein